MPVPLSADHLVGLSKEWTHIKRMTAPSNIAIHSKVPRKIQLVKTPADSTSDGAYAATRLQMIDIPTVELRVIKSTGRMRIGSHDEIGINFLNL